MVKISKKSRASRKNQKSRSARKNQKSRSNRNRSRGQRGGSLAAYSTGDAYLIDAASRVHAQTDGLDSVFAQLPSVIPRQNGGRSRRNRRNRRQHGGMQDWNQAFEKPLLAGMSQKAGRRSHLRSRKNRRSQRGGMSDINASPMLLDKGQYASAGQNPQFMNEAGVNPLYSEWKGPQ